MNVLELRGISKSFGRNQVLFSIDFDLRPGEIHGIMGENGAGKSTLMNIIYGNLKSDGGEIRVHGQTVSINGARDAQAYGICFVQQEIALCQDVTVAENIFMSRISQSRTFDRKKLVQEAKNLLEPLCHNSIDPNEIVERLPISSQQVVEIAKAISNNCKILILDEPTSSLSSAEADALHSVIQDLKKQGIAIIYISHRMSDIFGQCDRVSVLRDGRMVSTYPIEEANVQQLVNDMAGREVSILYPEKAKQISRTEEDVVLDVQNLTDASGRFKDVSFRLFKGEILGFAGLLGAGRSEIMEGIIGLRRTSAGNVFLKGKSIRGKSTSDIFRSGLIMLPEDRKTKGLFLDMDIEHNSSAAHLAEITRSGLIDRRKEHQQATQLADQMNIRCTGVSQIVRSLSGGNQQKVLMAKVLAKRPEVVIMDEPTRGVDVGAKAEIHRLLRQIANEGVSVILISSELNEVIGMSDRVAMIDSSGTLVGTLTGDEIHSDRIMYYISDAYKYQESKHEVNRHES